MAFRDALHSSNPIYEHQFSLKTDNSDNSSNTSLEVQGPTFIPTPGHSISRMPNYANTTALQSAKDYYKVLEFMKRQVDVDEQYAVRKQEAAERAIIAAADAKNIAEMTRKAADDAEKRRMELGDGVTLYSKALKDSLTAIKRLADVEERNAIRQQENAEYAIKVAANAKKEAEMTRKANNEREKFRREI